MTLVRWSPFREVEAMQSEMNRLFSRFGGFSGFNPEQTKDGQTDNNQWMLSVDVVEKQDAIQVKAALPGVEPQDIDIEVNDNILSISAQRRREKEVDEGSYHWIEQQYGTFSRSIALPRYVDLERIEASYNNGMLQLTVPKKESSKPRRIALKGDGNSQPRTLEAASIAQDFSESSQADEAAT